MSNILIVAPHPDDETLGCGGTIAKAVARGDSVYWLIVTCMEEGVGFSKNQIEKRRLEIQQINRLYQFKDMIQLNFPAANLNEGNKGKLIEQVGDFVDRLKIHTIYLPYKNDIHSDHKFVYEAIIAVSKWFRHKSVKRILCYETVSETNFSSNGIGEAFSPNVYEDITSTLNDKLLAMNVYSSEIGEHPFPRSIEAIKALAVLRGSECGCIYAEAFMLLKEIIDE